MDLEKIFDSAENLFYEIVITIVLIPKTIIRLYKNSKFPAEYVVIELAKPVNERFKNYLSPVKLTILVFAVPFLVPHEIDELNNKFTAEYILFFNQLPVIEQIVLLCFLVNLVPVIVSIYVLRATSTEISYETFRKPFYTFTYAFSYFYAAVISWGVLFFVFLKISGEGLLRFFSSNTWVIVIFGFSLILLMLFSWIKAFLAFYHSFKNFLNGDKRKSLWLSGLVVGLIILLFMLPSLLK